LGKRSVFFKIGAMFLALLMFLNVATPSFAHAEKSSKEEYDFEVYAKKLEKFVKQKKDGTIYLKDNYKNKVDVPEEVVNGINSWMDILNNEVLSGTVTIDKNLEIHYTDEKNNMLQESQFQTLSSSGINDFRVYWWGYKLYLDNANTKKLVDALYNAAGGATLATIISSAISTPGNPLIKALAGILALSGAALARATQNANKGKGVYYRFNGIAPTLFTGVFSQ
jgi:DNA-directed RNA polymerase beta' subunit